MAVILVSLPVVPRLLGPLRQALGSLTDSLKKSAAGRHDTQGFTRQERYEALRQAEDVVAEGGEKGRLYLAFFLK